MLGMANTEALSEPGHTRALRRLEPQRCRFDFQTRRATGRCPTRAPASQPSVLPVRPPTRVIACPLIRQRLCSPPALLREESRNRTWERWRRSKNPTTTPIRRMKNMVRNWSARRGGGAARRRSPNARRFSFKKKSRAGLGVRPSASSASGVWYTSTSPLSGFWIFLESARASPRRFPIIDFFLLQICLRMRAPFNCRINSLCYICPRVHRLRDANCRINFLRCCQRKLNYMGFP